MTDDADRPDRPDPSGSDEADATDGDADAPLRAELLAAEDGVGDGELDDAGGLGGGLDLGGLLAQAQEMQQQLLEAQASAAQQVVEGQSGGGVVRVTVDGSLRFQQVHIEPDVIDPGDAELLEDLVLAALHDAMTRLDEVQREAVGGGLDLGGMDLGGMDLGGLLGGGTTE